MAVRGAGANGSEPFCRRELGAATPGRGIEGGREPEGEAGPRAVEVDALEAEVGLPSAGDGPPGRGRRVAGEATLAAGEPFAAAIRAEGVA